MSDTGAHRSLVGQTLGSYRILSKIGRGGMGDVWLGEHTAIGRKAAIKILHPEFAAQPAIVQRFFNEARAANLVKHPGIVDIYDFGQAPGLGAYLVMEYLEGESLARRMRGGRPFAPVVAARIVARIASALGAAHARGIVHRDLKPDNVFLLPDPDHAGEERVKVLDFGIAKLGDALRGTSETVTGAVLGTPEYMSPEQCDGAKRVDQRTDVYALGVLAYKMLCGRTPFSAEGKGQVISMHLTQAPPPLGKWRQGLAAEVEAVVMRALEKEPDARFQTIEEMGRALLGAVGLDTGASLPERGFESQPTLARAPIPREPLPPAAVPREPKSPSTLAASASELSSAAPRARRTLAWLVPAVALGVAAGGAAIWLAVRTEEAVDAPPRPRAAAAAAEEATRRKSTPPPAPATVELAIESEPPGADVFRAADGVKVGTTPWHDAFARGPGEAMFLVKKVGFATERVSLSTTESATRPLVLAPEPEAAPTPPATATPRPAAKPAAKKVTHDYKPRLPE